MAVPVVPRNWRRADVRCVRAVMASSVGKGEVVEDEILRGR